MAICFGISGKLLGISSVRIGILVGNIILFSILDQAIVVRCDSNETSTEDIEQRDDVYDLIGPNDMIFLMDQSGSLWDKVEDRMKVYFKDLLRNYVIIHKHYTRIALIEVREETKLTIDTISQIHNVNLCNLLEDEHLNITNSGKDTLTEMIEAVKISRDIFKRGRKNRLRELERQILWLMTDADFERDNKHNETLAKLIKRQLDELKEDGVEIFGVGIKGFKYNAVNMSSLISVGEHYHLQLVGSNREDVWEKFTGKLTLKSEITTLNPSAVTITDEDFCSSNCSAGCYCDAARTGLKNQYSCYCDKHKCRPTVTNGTANPVGGVHLSLIIPFAVINGLIIIVMFITFIEFLISRSKRHKPQANENNVERQNTIETQTSPSYTGVPYCNQNENTNNTNPIDHGEEDDYVEPMASSMINHEYLRMNNAQNKQDTGVPDIIQAVQNENGFVGNGQTTLTTEQPKAQNEESVYENINAKHSYVNETVLKKLRKGVTHIAAVFRRSKSDKSGDDQRQSTGQDQGDSPVSRDRNTDGPSQSRVAMLTKMFGRPHGIKSARKPSEPNEYSLD